MSLNLRTVLMAAVVSTLFVTACSKEKKSSDIKGSHVGLRVLTTDEREKDFDQLLGLFQTFYGPIDYKKKVLGVDVVQISVNNTASGILRYRIPIALQAVEGKALVADITDELKSATGIAVGDEITEIDGKSPFDLLKVALKYRTLATDLSNQQNVVYSLYRPSYMTELIPAKSTAQIKITKANGKTLEVEIPWDVARYNENSPKIINGSDMDFSVGNAQDYGIDGHRLQLGQTKPVFLNSMSQRKFGFAEVYPSEAARLAVGLSKEEKPDIYAALYKFKKKNVLLMRVATYSPEDYKTSAYLKAYKALLTEYHDLADVLVIDQTHNPGGRVSYCAGLYELFAKDGDVQGVQQCRADRKWINDFKVFEPNNDENSGFEKSLAAAWGVAIEKAYDQGQTLSEPIAFFTGSPRVTDSSYRWDKPSLVLIDEMAGSCGDVFPMLVKANKRMKLFGQTTMGLGGNVEEVGTLNNSQISVKMTRGLFSAYKPDGVYQDSDYVENNGVAPDVFYSHTVEDFRKGFVKYVETFSDEAVGLAK
jgi:C-terminal processing protease CtpA/Prc